MPSTSPAAPVFLLLLAFLLLFPKYAVMGASDGLLLWFHTVLPTLAPAMICTQMILATGGVRLLMRPIHPLFRRLFSLSETGSFILLCGMLCGYPLGPALCAKAQASNQISPKEASRLLAFCSYPSPMFLLGYVQTQLAASFPVWILLTGIYAPALLLSWLSKKMEFHQETDLPIRQTSPLSVSHAQSLDETLYHVCDTMVLIGGYLMLFSIVSRLLTQANVLPAPVTALICAVTEMTTGIRQICKTIPSPFCLIACGASAAFGGISGIFQVRSVIGSEAFYDSKNAGFTIRHYVGWKLLHAGLSAMILTVLLQVLPP